MICLFYFRRFIFVMVFILGSMQDALAWKVDVHVYVAAQVAQAIEGNRIKLDLGGKTILVPIDPRYARAIRNHTRLFLLGSLGPDAFPDVWGGQIVIHPSYPGGWGTGDWLNHLMSKRDMTDQELAFALGYLTHAAADTFAHTFVNRYAGDVFDLTNHPSAAIRHIKLEGFVSNYLPEIAVSGQTGAAAALIRQGGKTEFPEDLMREMFLFNQDATEQMRAGGAPHFAAAKALYDDLGRMLGDDGIIAKIEELATDLAAEYLLGVPIDDEITKDLARLKREIDKKVAEAGENLMPVANWLNDEIAKIEGLPVNAAESATEAALDISREIGNLAVKIADFKADIAKKENELANWGTRTVTEEACDWIGKIGGKVIKEGCKQVSSTVFVDQKLRNAVIAALDETKKLLSNANDEIDRKRQDMRKALYAGFDTVRKAQEVRRLARKTIIDFALQYPKGGLRGYFARWHDGIPVAMVEYTRANADAIINSIDPSILADKAPDAPGTLTPIKHWLLCYGPIFLSVPEKITTGACATFGAFQDFRDQLDEFEQALADVVPPAGELLELKKELDQLVAEVQNEIQDELTNEGLAHLQRITKKPVLELYKALTEKMDRQKVSAEFAHDPSGQGLPVISDAGGRVLLEMNVHDGKLDVERFHPLYNAIVLAKLSMLDQSGLNRLARMAGVRNTVYGRDLYQGNNQQARNVLFGFIRSIDGNHQWQELSPPHPRGVAVYDEKDFEERSKDPSNFGFGYRDGGCGQTRVQGMRMWVDPVARERLFKALFRGPVATGVDNPSRLQAGLDPVLHANYPLQLGAEGDWLEDGISLITRSFTIRLAGSGRPGRGVEVFLSGRPIWNGNYNSEGQLEFSHEVSQVSLPTRLDVTETGRGPGIRASYSLGCDGKPTQEGKQAPPDVMVRRGDTLWHISERMTGEGEEYPALHAANRDLIRDPDLIYPGQIFVSPWAAPVELSIEGIN